VTARQELSPRLRLAVDIGGTFTDLVVEASDGSRIVRKAPTNRTDLLTGVREVITAAAVSPAQVDIFVHGTTAGLNAVLERNGPRIALIMTAGFGDTYFIGRGNRLEMYNLRYQKPRPLIDEGDVFEITERLAADGSEIAPLDNKEASKLTQTLVARGYEVVAICFLHAHRNPHHELELRQLLQKHLDSQIPILLSHEVAPESREYERCSTLVLSAYITPLLNRYLDDLELELGRRQGDAASLMIMSSSGGMVPARDARLRAVTTLFSGPVGGALAGKAISRRLGMQNLICTDTGGTSFDVSLVRDGELSTIPEFELQGLPVLAPAVEVLTIGAGGGSVIHQGRHGGLRVGPDSAGADPGPACYGRGGREATLTDANVALGRIPAGMTLSGAFSLDEDAATASLVAVAERFGITATALAEQALEVAHFSMAQTIRELTVERGLDPADFALCAFGGAGGLHAAFIAEELEINRVIVPAHPGVLSAWGMLRCDIRHDAVHAFHRSLVEGISSAAETLSSMISRLADDRELGNLTNGATRYMRMADLRYADQEYFLTIPMHDDEDATAVGDRFHDMYFRRYGHSEPSHEVEIVALRVSAVTPVGTEVDTPASRELSTQQTSTTSIRAIFDSVAHETAVRANESVIEKLVGPMIIFDRTGTTVVPPAWSVRPIEDGHLLLTPN
jgi:N-methylhydantoinase A